MYNLMITFIFLHRCVWRNETNIGHNIIVSGENKICNEKGSYLPVSTPPPAGEGMHSPTSTQWSVLSELLPDLVLCWFPTAVLSPCSRLRLSPLKPSFSLLHPVIWMLNEACKLPTLLLFIRKTKTEQTVQKQQQTFFNYICPAR